MIAPGTNDLGPQTYFICDHHYSARADLCMIAPSHHPYPILDTSLRKFNLAILKISRIIVPNHYPLTTNHYPLSTSLLHLVSYLSFSFFARDTVNDPPLAGKL